MPVNDIDSGLETLLNLDGEIFPMDNGYWTKFEVKRVEPNEHRRHGIRYSLTLHDKYNRRVIGFDNAHAVKTKGKKFSAKKTTWDHKHNKRRVASYEFESAGQLLTDFWKEVEKAMSETEG